MLFDASEGGAYDMRKDKAIDKAIEKRYTVSFNPTQVEGLERIAARNAVAVSWIVRLAVDEFLRSHASGQLKLDFDSAA